MSGFPENLAKSLRQDFDAGFARLANSGSKQGNDLLAIRVDDAALALRVSEISGVFTDCKSVTFPSSVNAFAGLVGFRGSAVPVYDLGVLLNGSRLERRRWLVLSSTHSVAFSFDAFEGHLRLDQAQIVPAEQTMTDKLVHVREVVRTDATTRPIIHLGSLVEHLQSLISPRENQGD